MSATVDEEGGVEMTTPEPHQMVDRQKLKETLYDHRSHPKTDKDMAKLLAKVDALVDDEINDQRPYNATFCGLYFKEPGGEGSWMHNFWGRVDIANILVWFLCLVLCALLIAFTEFNATFVATDQIGLIDLTTNNTWYAIETFQSYIVSNMMFAVVGFALLYATCHKYVVGGIGSTLFIAAFVLQWGLLVNGAFVWFEDKYNGGATSNVKGIEMTLHNMLAGTRPVIAFMISYATLVGKASTEQSIFMAFIHTIFYATNNWLITSVFRGYDLGCFSQWTFGVSFGLAAATFYSRRDTKKHADERPSQVSDAFALLGACVMFVYFPSVVASQVLSQHSARASINTALAMAASTVGAFTASKFWATTKNTYDAKDIRFGMLAGGIVMSTSAAVTANPGVASISGFVAGWSCVAVRWLSKPMWDWIGTHDSNGTYGYFGWATWVGCCVSVFSAWKAYGETNNTIYGLALSSIFYGKSQPAIHLGMWATSIAFGVVGGLFAGFMTKIFIGSPLRYFNDGVQFRMFNDFLEREEADLRERIFERELAKQREAEAESEDGFAK